MCGYGFIFNFAYGFQEGDMPLEALLAMYGYGAPDPMAGGDHAESAGSNSEEEILNNHDLTLDKEEVIVNSITKSMSFYVIMGIAKAFNGSRFAIGQALVFGVV